MSNPPISQASLNTLKNTPVKIQSAPGMSVNPLASYGSSYANDPYLQPASSYASYTAPTIYIPNNNGVSSPAAQPNSASNATNPANTNPLADYQNILNGLNNGTNKYYDALGGIYQTGYQNQQNYYNTNNQNLLGTQDGNAQAAFLNSVLTPEQIQQGRLEYGYNLGQNNENAMYGLQTTANTQNRALALNKLSNDENFALQGMGLNQGKENASTIDSLNSRGLLYGQNPTGQYQPNAMGGMHGLAGQQAGLVNQDYGIQRGQLTSDYGLNTLGTNQQYDQAQNQLNQQHTYNSQENAFNAANGIQDQNNQYTFNTAQNNNQLAQYKLANAQQQQNDLNTNSQTAYNKALIKNNAYTATS